MKQTLRVVGILAGAGALLLAAGCKSLGSCNKPGTYSSAEEIPPLKMPIGLDGPDTALALKIPPLREPEVPRDANAPCLEEPPPMKEKPSMAPASGAPEEAPPARQPYRRPPGVPR
jgi:hypothetical protein